MKFDVWSLILGILIGALLLAGPVRKLTGKVTGAVSG